MKNENENEKQADQLPKPEDERTSVRTAPKEDEAEKQRVPQYDSFMRVIRR